MGPPEREELFTLNYGPERSGRRWSTREKTLLLVIVFALLGFAMIFVHPRRVGGPGASIPITRAQMDLLSSSLHLYRRHMGTYPFSLNDLVKPPSGKPSTTWRGSYVDGADRLADAWRQEFQYRSPGIHNAQHYDLWRIGKDGEDGSDDDICNWASDDP